MNYHTGLHKIMSQIKPLGENRIIKSVGTALLITIAVGGVIALVAVAPGASMLLKSVNDRHRKRKYTSWDTTRALRRLEKQGYVQRLRKGQKEFVKLSDLGKEKIKKLQLASLSIRTPKKWDRKWRMVFFDIPKNKERVRNTIRLKLKELGFYQIQKSVYVHPYECRDVIVRLQELYQVKKYIHFATVVAIQNESHYKKHFNVT